MENNETFNKWVMSFQYLWFYRGRMPGFTEQPPRPTPWATGHQGAGEEGETETMSENKRNIQKWEKDEPLGELATISPVLYCNINHPDLRENHPGEGKNTKSIQNQ